jgi:hypothetical protein
MNHLPLKTLDRYTTCFPRLETSTVRLAWLTASRLNVQKFCQACSPILHVALARGSYLGRYLSSTGHTLLLACLRTLHMYGVHCLTAGSRIESTKARGFSLALGPAAKRAVEAGQACAPSITRPRVTFGCPGAKLLRITRQ